MLLIRLTGRDSALGSQFSDQVNLHRINVSWQRTPDDQELVRVGNLYRLTTDFWYKDNMVDEVLEAAEDIKGMRCPDNSSNPKCVRYFLTTQPYLR